MTRMHNPPHPGSILADWLDGLDDMTITRFADYIHVTRATLSRIINGHSSITPDIAIRLHMALGTSSELWIGMQGAYDLWVAENKERPTIKRIADPVIEEPEFICA